MQFDAALAAREAFQRSQMQLGPDWLTAVDLEDRFSSSAGASAREAYEHLLLLAAAHPNADAFHAFCIYITWQQVTEETIPRHFRTGLELCESYLGSPEGKDPRDIDYVTELLESFRAGLGLTEEDDIAVEYRRDTPKGGD
ncbi:conserved protein of unknown function [Nitrospira japonica]|uniref:Uncharacterized protein n=2 Tax=Nitrospira japonica TaxID=1325564 RepID=A0A1W1I835_9BACT|nr:conserved protein of unknown function [Nitrospira japonica]